MSRTGERSKAGSVKAGKLSWTHAVGSQSDRAERFPYLLVFGPSVLFVGVYVAAVKIGIVEAWVERMIVWGMR